MNLIKKLEICGFALLLIALAVRSEDEMARFDGYRVYSALPSTLEDVYKLKLLQEAGYDFWTEIKHTKSPVDIMVAPHQRAHFKEILENSQIKAYLQIEDVQTYIDKERRLLSNKDVSGFNFENYYRLDVINNYLNELAQNYSTVKVIVGGQTYENRSITGVHVSFKPNNRAIFIEGGIHAREWIGPATALYILTQLLTSTDKNIRHIAEKYDWYFFPSVNPDGYEYTHTTNRLWRKTRKPYGTCTGADPNRNWNFHWNEAGTSNSPCSESFAGSEAFSEIEAKSLSQFISSVANKLDGYIAFHSYSQLMLIPYGHTAEHLDNYDDLYSIGIKAADSLSQRYGTKYTVGDIYETIYPASGTSMDWVKGTFKTNITYTYELRDTGRYGFLLPPSQIIPNCEEVMDSFVTIFLEAEKMGY